LVATVSPRLFGKQKLETKDVKMKERVQWFAACWVVGEADVCGRTTEGEMTVGQKTPYSLYATRVTLSNNQRRQIG